MDSLLDSTHYWKSLYLRELADDAIDTFVNHCSAVTSPQSFAFLFPLHGAFSWVGRTKTAYSHRDARYCFGIMARWSLASEAEKHIAWARAFWDAMKPFSIGEVYVHWTSGIGEEWVNAAYGPNYARLARVKQRYDPTNFFRSNLNIRPAA